MKQLSGGRDLAKLGDFGGKFIQAERSFPDRFAKIVFGSGFWGIELLAGQVSFRKLQGDTQIVAFGKRHGVPRHSSFLPTA